MYVEIPSGNVTANLFNGVATSSRFADLAEKYTTGDIDLLPGTAVAVGGDAEVREAKASDICIGVVSTDPGLMMNSEADGQYIALKGRVPVRVKGVVQKGQAIYAWADGICPNNTNNCDGRHSIRILVMMIPIS